MTHVVCLISDPERMPLGEASLSPLLPHDVVVLPA